jgi:hypothetical protein
LRKLLGIKLARFKISPTFQTIFFANNFLTGIILRRSSEKKRDFASLFILAKIGKIKKVIFNITSIPQKEIYSFKKANIVVEVCSNYLICRVKPSPPPERGINLESILPLRGLGGL